MYTWCNNQPSSSDSNRRNVNSKSTVGTKVRKYNTEYLQLGFTFARTEDEPKPQFFFPWRSYPMKV
ncbi:hypothetical protein QTP88_006776 [Uroleucon formosanum]